MYRGRGDIALDGKGVENGREKTEIVKIGQKDVLRAKVPDGARMRGSGRETTRVIRAVRFYRR